jgi:hypothetical protein
MDINQCRYVLFHKAGKDNSGETIAVCKENAEKLEIKTIIVASTNGETAKLAAEIFDLLTQQVICVTHSAYFKENVPHELAPELRVSLEQKGMRFVTGTLAFSGVGSSLLKKYQYFDTTTLFARLVRGLFADGVKVCMEIAMMACDAGLVSPGQEILTVAGTGWGADTCCWIKAMPSRMFDQLRVHAIFAKPL